MMEKQICGKCGGEMEKGILIDLYHPGTVAFSAQAAQQQWVAGGADQQKSPSFLAQPVNIPGFCAPPAGAKNVVTYRCVSCGYLESYAK